MGQGTESAGGYEIVYDPYGYDESNGFTVWHGKDCDYRVNEMSDSHIKRAIKLCRKLSIEASFSCDSEKWEDWINVFESELGASYRPILKRSSAVNRGKNGNGKRKVKSIKKAIKDGLITVGTVNMMCHCGAEYKAKAADLKRGWALSCSKRCAAIRRDYGRNEATLLMEEEG